MTSFTAICHGCHEEITAKDPEGLRRETTAHCNEAKHASLKPKESCNVFTLQKNDEGNGKGPEATLVIGPCPGLDENQKDRWTRVFSELGVRVEGMQVVEGKQVREPEGV